MPVISALGRLRQEDQEFEANLSYVASPYLKKTNKAKKYCLILLKESNFQNTS
jgi:hypothetical protein